MEIIGILEEDPFQGDYYLLMGSVGIYKIVDGKAYGREFRYGINVDDLAMRIKEYKGVNG
ncbi:MAG: hypothetical protein QW572_01640 [Candidatus Nitrosocaldus sp.]